MVKKVTKQKGEALLAPEQLQVLRRMNLAQAVVFALEMVAVVLFGGTKTVAVVAHYLAVDQLASQANGHQVLATASRQLFDVRITVLAALFLGVFALISL